MVSAKIRKNGRVVIPQATRELYNLQEGDVIEFTILRVKKENGLVVDFRDAAKEDIAISEAKEEARV